MDNKEKAMNWWNNTSNRFQKNLSNRYYNCEPQSLTGREIEKIYLSVVKGEEKKYTIQEVQDLLWKLWKTSSFIDPDARDVEFFKWINENL